MKHLTNMQYFYSNNISEHTGSLEEQESKHCTKVLRQKAGDEIGVLDGEGTAYRALITSVKPIVTFDILEKIREEAAPKTELTLAICPTKSTDRIEWMLEKIVEIGIHSVCFIKSQNSERARLNETRMLKKTISAMKQSGNLWLPKLKFDIKYKDFVETDAAELKLIAHCKEGAKQSIGNLPKAKTISILIGPEGDFTTDEIVFSEKAGFHPVTLGESRLRTETAGLVACTLINYFSVN